MKKVLVYRLSIKGTGKSFVGATKTDGIRSKAFIEAMKAERKSPLQEDICRYGRDSIYVKILETCDESVKQDRKDYWIDKLQTRAPKGYNVSLDVNYYVPYTEPTP